MAHEIQQYDLKTIKQELIIVQRTCSELKLIQTAKWAAELSESLDVDVDVLSILPQESSKEFWKEYDRFTLAQSCFDLKEYDRAAYTLRDCSSSKATFLKYYALYMADQKFKSDNTLDANDHSEPVANDMLITLKNELSEKANNKELDGFSLYLYAVVLTKLSLHATAVETFIQALTHQPLNWAAWMELSRLISDKEMFQLKTLNLPNTWMKHLFLAKAYTELGQYNEALTIYTAFSQHGFEKSPYIAAQMAVTYHDMREMEKSVKAFSILEKMDPYRVENMDTYSNVLYVNDKRSELAHLAHRCCKINKYSVETCSVIGNYYSMRAEHEKSILYFQRALKLNPNYISAWTLLGHEYMELKNTSAATQAYRRAIEVDDRDYRAWYGLGQTYEILKLPSYALYYYKKAQFLKPHDSRMMVALGMCYQKMEKWHDAKKCFWKALCLGDIEEVALIKLATLYDMLGEEDQACQAFTNYINKTDSKELYKHEDLCQAYRYLAHYHKKQKNWMEAYNAALKCSEFDQTRLESKALLREIQTMRGMEGVSIMEESKEAPAETHDSTPVTGGRFIPNVLNFTP